MNIFLASTVLSLSLMLVSLYAAGDMSKAVSEQIAKPEAIEAVIHLKSKKELDQALAEVGPKVFKCSVTWCGPCKIVQKDLEKLAQEYRGVVKVYVIDGDSSEFSDFMKEHRVRYYPTLVFLPSGKQLIGVQPLESYAQAFKEVAQLVKK